MTKKGTENVFTLRAVGLRLLLSLLLLELHVAVVHDGPCQLVHRVFLLLSEAQHIEGALPRQVNQKSDKKQGFSESTDISLNLKKIHPLPSSQAITFIL